MQSTSLDSSPVPLQSQPLSGAALDEHCKTTMAKGSKSFSLAALLFDKDRREAARLLYSWCRHCDDAVDQAPSKEAALAALDELRTQTRAAFRGEVVVDPAFVAFRELCLRYKIPELYPLELLEGMRMDVEGHVYRTERDLRLYCYRVASVVGLMMVHVMGVSSARALRHAVDTGMAMQMTNIARDVREDFEMGRIYLPASWFKELSLRRPNVTDAFDPATFAPVARRLVARADELYASGRAGLKYLPWRAALAVGAAQTIYRAIGHLVVRRGQRAWDRRAVVSKAAKFAFLAGSIAFITTILASRLLAPWRRSQVDTVFGPDRL